MTTANRVRGEVRFEALDGTAWILRPKFHVVLHLEEKFGDLFEAFRRVKSGRLTDIVEVLWAGATLAGREKDPTREQIGEAVLQHGITDERVTVPAGLFLSDMLVGLSKPASSDEEGDAPEEGRSKSDPVAGDDGAGLRIPAVEPE